MPPPAGQLSVLVTEKAVSERTLGGIGSMRLLCLPGAVGAFHISSKMVDVVPHLSAILLRLSKNISLSSGVRDPHI